MCAEMDESGTAHTVHLRKGALEEPEVKNLANWKTFSCNAPALYLLSHMDNNLDIFFHALADPTRRAVIERLTEGPAPVSTLHAPHDMALPTFMKHLKVLEAAKLVRSEKNGRVRTVHIEAHTLDAGEAWLKQQRRLWKGRLDRIDALIQAQKGPKT